MLWHRIHAQWNERLVTFWHNVTREILKTLTKNNIATKVAGYIWAVFVREDSGLKLVTAVVIVGNLRPVLASLSRDDLARLSIRKHITHCPWGAEEQRRCEAAWLEHLPFPRCTLWSRARTSTHTLVRSPEAPISVQGFSHCSWHWASVNVPLRTRKKPKSNVKIPTELINVFEQEMF